MWTRAELKAAAKNVLKTSYWYGVVEVLVFVAIVGAASGIAGPLVPFVILAIPFFGVNPLAVGLMYFFLQNRKGEVPKIEDLFHPFRNGPDYLKTVGAMAWATLFYILWMLIPVADIVLGIVKGIAYGFTPYILADNPGIGYKRALKLSMAMTEGHKWNIFVLCLSFLGWYILAVIPAGIGLLFLAPYVQATFAELYVTLRTEAIRKGLCTAEELKLVSAAAPDFAE